MGHSPRQRSHLGVSAKATSPAGGGEEGLAVTQSGGSATTDQFEARLKLPTLIRVPVPGLFLTRP
jgi:hypothetical protein